MDRKTYFDHIESVCMILETYGINDLYVTKINETWFVCKVAGKNRLTNWPYKTLHEAINKFIEEESDEKSPINQQKSED